MGLVSQLATNTRRLLKNRLKSPSTVLRARPEFIEGTNGERFDVKE